jgi:hypothetical protein
MLSNHWFVDIVANLLSNLRLLFVADGLECHCETGMTTIEKPLPKPSNSENLSIVPDAPAFKEDFVNPDVWLFASAPAVELEVDAEMLEKARVFAFQVLVWRGFIPGRDFSMTETGNIFVNAKAKVALLESVSIPERVLLQTILQVPERIY